MMLISKIFLILYHGVKDYSLFIIILMLAWGSQTIYAQTLSDTTRDWVWQNPLPQGNNLNDITQIGSSKLMAVGEGGTIVTTENNGVSWSNIFHRKLYRTKFNSVYFPDLNNGWIVGDSGVVIRTRDGGKSWEEYKKLSLTNKLKRIIFINTQVGWITGERGLVLKTNDAGANWHKQISPIERTLNSIFFISESLGWVCGDIGALIRTTNGGTSWDSIISYSFSDFNDIKFINQQYGFLAGSNGSIRRTTNGGIDWINVNTSTSNSFNSISTISSNNVIITGDQGNVIYSNNGGLSWKRDSLETICNLTKIFFSSPNDGWIVGTNGSIWRTLSSVNLNWISISQGFIPNIRAVKVVNPSVTYVVGATGFIGKLLYPSSSWIVQQSDVSHTLNSIDFWDTNSGCVVGDTGTILLTNDGGGSWSSNMFITDANLYSVRYHSSSLITAVGSHGSVLISTNGGSRWQLIHYDSLKTFRSHYSFDGITIWAAGDTTYKTIGGSSIIIGQIYESKDGGKTWLSHYSGPIPPLSSIFFTNQNSGFSVGTDGVILRFTDSGWISSMSPVRKSLTSIFFSDDSMGWACGMNGAMIRTKNGGRSWNQIISGTPKDIYSLYFIDSLNGWIFGNSGSILKTKTGGGKPLIVEPPLPPTKIEPVGISQNHPNPFYPLLNGVTYFPFRIDNPSYVRVKIYNILGKLIRDIIAGNFEKGVHVGINDNKTQGAKSDAPSWDGRDNNGNDVPSGIYFYMVKTAEYIETKKLVLLR